MAIFTPPGFGCKGLFSRVFGLPPPATCPIVPGTRPMVGDVSQKRCLKGSVNETVMFLPNPLVPPAWAEGKRDDLQYSI